jgi:uncharacterized protein YpbB
MRRPDHYICFITYCDTANYIRTLKSNVLFIRAVRVHASLSYQGRLPNKTSNFPDTLCVMKINRGDVRTPTSLHNLYFDTARSEAVLRMYKCELHGRYTNQLSRIFNISTGFSLLIQCLSCYCGKIVPVLPPQVICSINF